MFVFNEIFHFPFLSFFLSIFPLLTPFPPSVLPSLFNLFCRFLFFFFTFYFVLFFFVANLPKTQFRLTVFRLFLSTIFHFRFRFNFVFFRLLQFQDEQRRGIFGAFRRELFSADVDEGQRKGFPTLRQIRIPAEEGECSGDSFEIFFYRRKRGNSQRLLTPPHPAFSFSPSA